MGDSGDDAIPLTGGKDSSKAADKEESSNLGAELSTFSGFLSSIKRGDSLTNEIRGNQYSGEMVIGDTYDKDDEATRWSGNEFGKASNDSQAWEIASSNSNSYHSYSKSMSNLASNSGHLGQSDQSRRSSQSSKLIKETKTDDFAGALAKLPLVCTSPSSLAHLGMTDMKVLLRSNKEINTKISKEDLRYKLFLLIKDGQFERHIIKLQQSRQLQVKGGGASRDGGMPAGRSEYQSGTTVRHFVTSVTGAELWEDVDKSLFEVASEEMKQSSTGGCWERATAAEEEILESGNPEYFSKRMLKSYLLRRHSSMHYRMPTDAEARLSDVETKDHENRGKIVQQLKAIITGLRTKSEEKDECTNPATLDPLIKRTAQLYQDLRIVVFNSDKLGLRLEKKGASAVVVRNKTPFIDPMISPQVRIGDEIVYAAGVDMQSLTYKEKLDAVETKDRPLVLGFAGSDASL